MGEPIASVGRGNNSPYASVADYVLQLDSYPLKPREFCAYYISTLRFRSVATSTA